MTAKEWNEKYPIGTPVFYRPILGLNEGRDTKTRSEAWTLGHGAAVVKIDGLAGWVWLDAVSVVSREVT